MTEKSELSTTEWGCTGCSRTLEEVGKALQVMRERIRQIEARALDKLRSHSSGCQLQEYLE